MKLKKLFSFLLILILTLSVTGGFAFAAGAELYIGSAQVILPADGNTVYENLSEADSAWWVINNGGVISLYLNNLVITDDYADVGTDGYLASLTEESNRNAAVYASLIDDFVIVVCDGTENILGSKAMIDDENYFGIGLYTEGCNVTITGEDAKTGVLKCYSCATAPGRGVWVNYFDDDYCSLTVASCTLEAFGGAYGIAVDYDITADAAIINAESGEYQVRFINVDLESDDGYLLNNSINYYDNAAIHSAYGDVRFTDSNVTAISGGGTEIFANAISTYQKSVFVTRGQLYAELSVNLSGNAIYPNADLHIDSAKVETVSSMDGIWLGGKAFFTGNAKVDSTASENALYAEKGFVFSLTAGGYVHGQTATDEGIAFTSVENDITFADKNEIILPVDGVFKRNENAVDDAGIYYIFTKDGVIAKEATVAFVVPEPNPPTGDSAKVLVYAGIAFVSAFSLTVIIRKKKKAESK